MDDMFIDLRDARCEVDFAMEALEHLIGLEDLRVDHLYDTFGVTRQMDVCREVDTPKTAAADFFLQFVLSGDEHQRKTTMWAKGPRDLFASPAHVFFTMWTLLFGCHLSTRLPYCTLAPVEVFEGSALSCMNLLHIIRYPQ